MKNLNRCYFGFILLLGMNQTLSAQDVPGKIWVSIENSEDVPVMNSGKIQSSNRNVQALMDEFNVFSVAQAVPNSRQERLLKVYEIECDCDANHLLRAIEARSSELTELEIGPDYQLMYTPDDYSMAFTNDYALNLINAQSAWDYSTGDTSIVIGISDANYYVTHEDLQEEFVYMDYTNTHPNYAHGTCVAATAAGKTNNNAGKSSIGFDCKLSLFRLGYDGLLEMTYAGVRVINMSWASGCGYSPYCQEIIDEVYNNGTILVAAAGNGVTCGGPANLVYPASFNHVISVTGIGEFDNHERTIGDPATTCQHNSLVDISAPAYYIPGTSGPGAYLYASGTSFAAPYVSGTIGLMLSARPCMRFEDVLEILQLSATNIDAQNPNYVGLLGAGRLDAGEALALTMEIDCGGGPIVNSGSGETSSSSAEGSNGTTSGGGNGIGNGNELSNITHTNISSTTIGNNSNGISSSKPSNDESGTEAIGNKYINSTHGGDEIARNNAGFQEEDLVEAKIYPNPTASTSILTWNVRESMKLTVSDVRGIAIYQEEISSSTNRTTIDLDESGVYFIQLEKDGEQKWIGKLIKM